MRTHINHCVRNFHILNLNQNRQVSANNTTKQRIQSQETEGKDGLEDGEMSMG